MLSSGAALYSKNHDLDRIFRETQNRDRRRRRGIIIVINVLTQRELIILPSFYLLAELLNR